MKEPRADEWHVTLVFSALRVVEAEVGMRFLDIDRMKMLLRRMCW